MNPNTYSISGSSRPADRHPPQPPDELDELTALLDRMAARDLDRLTGPARAERVQRLRRLADRLDGQWLKELAGVDACGEAGAEHGVQFGSTAGWLRARLRMASGTAATAVRTARALFRGPLPATAEALCAGEISAAHAEVLAASTLHLPDHVIEDTEPTLLDAARRLDPTGLRQVVAHLQYTVDPDGADRAAQRRHERRGVWFSTTFDRMVAVRGIMAPEAGQTLQAALDPLARPADAADTRSGGQRTADALAELARRQLEAGQLPKTGGVRPQLSVIVDLNSLGGQPSRIGGDIGWAGPLEPQACRRLACDATITRVVVSRQPLDGCDRCPGGNPQDLGRATRVVTPAQRQALAVRDGGCVFPGCSRPLAWCEGHHVWHWLDGGPTDLDNLALVCRAHHRAVHEGGWRLIRGPDGQFTATPPHRRTRAA